MKHQIVNDLPLGRNIDEAIRMLDALQHVETAGEVCPAGWNKGKAAMKANAGGIAGYLKEHSEGALGRAYARPSINPPWWEMNSSLGRCYVDPAAPPRLKRSDPQRPKAFAGRPI